MSAWTHINKVHKLGIEESSIIELVDHRLVN